jgi:tripartite-type tricarboxylate transporter receptor subunit TctC
MGNWNSYMKRNFTRATALTVLVIASLGAGFPEKDKVLTIVTPFPAGSTSDMIPRLLAPHISKALNVSVVVDNRPGANGSLGAAYVARAAPDGHTILLGTTGVLAINQWIYAKPQYLPERDFVPITNAASTPNMLVVHPGVKANTLKELIALARSQPQPLTYASAGYGSTSHLCGEMLKTVIGADLTHIPFKGPAPASQDLLSGSVSMMCDNFPNVLANVQAGRLKAIVLTGPGRTRQLPNVPTSAEVGFPELQAGIWYGFVAPAGTPKEAVDKLNTVIGQALRHPAVRDRLLEIGLDVIADKPEAFKQFISQESARMKKIVAASGARID